MKKEDLKKRLGALPSSWDERDLPYASIPTIKEKELPEEYSLRSEQTPVRHQGEVGACTSFAACAINETIQKVKDLSERHLYCRRANKPGLGMAPRDACKILHKKGVSLEACWPYISDSDKLCKGSPCENVDDQSQRYRITSYHRCFNSLKATLFSTKLPILIVVPVYENWENISENGKVPMPGGNMVSYHALVMTGWSKKYLEVKNSWGSGFGDNGYLHIPQNYPVTEGWAMEKSEVNGEEKKVEVDGWNIAEKSSIFGLVVTFTILSKVRCRMITHIDGKQAWFGKRVREGTNLITVNVPFKNNAESNIKIEFFSAGFRKRELFGIWNGTLKTEVFITRE